MARARKTMEDRRAEVERLQAAIVSEVEKLRDSDRWTEFLEASKAFHRYSVNNLLLILSQKPEATQIAGYQTWQKQGRQVRKGEKGLRIFGGRPVAYVEKDQATGKEEEKTRMRFFPVSVFDISQTDPIDPTAPVKGELAPRLEGEDPAGIYEKVEAHLVGLGWEVSRKDLGSQVNGHTRIGGDKEVVVHEGLSPAQAAKTLIHEAAHVHMHSTEDFAEYVAHRGVKETEAESVAYVVAGSFGLDTSSYSIGYVAGWSDADSDLIKETASRVVATSHSIIEAISDPVPEKDQALTQGVERPTERKIPPPAQAHANSPAARAPALTP